MQVGGDILLLKLVCQSTPYKAVHFPDREKRTEIERRRVSSIQAGLDHLLGQTVYKCIYYCCHGLSLLVVYDTCEVFGYALWERIAFCHADKPCISVDVPPADDRVSRTDDRKRGVFHL